jgi:hypothetical protein
MNETLIPVSKPKCIALGFQNKKEGIFEFDVDFIDGKPYAIVGPVLGGRLVERIPLHPSRLYSKSAPYDYFYMAPLRLDIPAN